MSFDQAGFNQELKELCDKFGMMLNVRFVHRYHCDIRKGFERCTCVGRTEYAVYRADMETEEKARQVMLGIGEQR